MSHVPQLMSINEAARATSLSRTSIFKLRERGEFPAAVTLSEKRVAFVREEVGAWIEARISSRKHA